MMQPAARSSFLGVMAVVLALASACNIEHRFPDQTEGTFWTGTKIPTVAGSAAGKGVSYRGKMATFKGGEFLMGDNEAWHRPLPLSVTPTEDLTDDETSGPYRPARIGDLTIEILAHGEEAYTKCVNLGGCPIKETFAQGYSYKAAQDYCGWLGLGLPTVAMLSRAFRNTDGRLTYSNNPGVPGYNPVDGTTSTSGEWTTDAFGTQGYYPLGMWTYFNPTSYMLVVEEKSIVGLTGSSLAHLSSHKLNEPAYFRCASATSVEPTKFTDPTAQQVTGKPDLADIAVGGAHTCILTNQGAVWCWGDNSAGQLGTGKVWGSYQPIAPLSVQASSIATGWFHTCIAYGGHVSCWGDNRAGQLGFAPTADQPSVNIPTPAPEFDFQNEATLYAYGRATCLSGNPVRCWGSFLNGPIVGSKNGKLTPTNANGTRVVMGGNLACSWTLGDLQPPKCWGQLPGGVRMADDTTELTELAGKATEGAGGGDDFLCFWTATELTCLGNVPGHGSGTFVLPREPNSYVLVQRAGFSVLAGNGYRFSGEGAADLVPVLNPADKPISFALTVGPRHACARFLGGDMKCWGNGNHGELGARSYGIDLRKGVPEPIEPSWKLK
jgi:hypothetical protein